MTQQEALQHWEAVKAFIDAHPDDAPPVPAPEPQPDPVPIPEPPDDHPHPLPSSEHEAIMALVAEEEATHVAVPSGVLWSQPTTWRDGKVPGDDARVFIPGGCIVAYDVQHNPPLIRSLGIEGKFINDIDNPTEAAIGTLVNCGVMEIAGQFTLTHPDRWPLDPQTDPFQFGCGFHNCGTLRMKGKEKASWTRLTESAGIGRFMFEVEDATGWHPGDILCLSSFVPGQHELATIAGVSGNTVTLVKPLQFPHYSRDYMDRGQIFRHVFCYAENLTRSITIQSANPTGLRGHFMSMVAYLSLKGVAFKSLGRTDKSRPVTDATAEVANEAGRVNPRGRYACHLHRAGNDHNSQPAEFTDCVVWDSTGWGFVNHSSHATFTGCVAHDVLGAAFVGEIGDEIGTFEDCASIFSKGSGSTNEADDRGNHDWGHLGHGIHIQGGGGIQVIDNIHSGHQHAVTFNSLDTKGVFPISNAWFPANSPWGDHMNSDEVPLRIERLTCYGNREFDLMLWNIRQDSYHDLRGFINDSTFAGPVFSNYSAKTNWRNPIFGAFYGHAGIMSAQDFDNPRMYGYFQCGEPPNKVDPNLRIIGGWCEGEIVIQNIPSDVATEFVRVRRIAFDGNMGFGIGGKVMLKLDYTHFGEQHKDDPNMAPAIFSRFALGDDQIMWGDRYLFFPQQHPSYSLADWTGLPVEQRTTVGENQQAGRFVGEYELPADAERMPFGNGWWSKTPAIERRVN